MVARTNWIICEDAMLSCKPSLLFQSQSFQDFLGRAGLDDESSTAYLVCCVSVHKLRMQACKIKNTSYNYCLLHVHIFSLDLQTVPLSGVRHSCTASVHHVNVTSVWVM